MNKIIKPMLTVVVIFFVGWNIAVNIALRKTLATAAPEVSFAFAVSPLPDRVVLAGVRAGGFGCPAALVDLNIAAFLKKDFRRALDGLILVKPSFVYVKSESRVRGGESGIIIPHCRYINILDGSLEYFDPGRSLRFGLYSVNGKSEYVASQVKSGEFLVFDLKGLIQNDKRYPAELKFFYFPYFINRFHMALLTESVDARLFEPFFADYNLVIDSGEIKIAVQTTGENRRVRLASSVEVSGLKIREDSGGLDVKQFFGVSYEQMGRFLTDAGGNMRIDFEFEIPDSQLASLPEFYGKRFGREMGDRIKLGVLTAPLRGAVGLLWNLTGENVINFFKLFDEKKE